MRNEKIVEIFDAVKPNERLKGKIMNAIEAEEGEKLHLSRVAQNIIRNIRNVAAVILVVLISSVSIYGFGVKSLEEYFFAKTGSESLEEAIVSSKQRFRVDDYTITLKEYLIEEDRRQIYMVVEAAKRDGVPEITRIGDKVCYFGEGDRFRITAEDAEIEVQGEIREKRVLLYIHVDASDTDEELEELVFLEDRYKQEKNTVSRYCGCYVRHYFQLK